MRLKSLFTEVILPAAAIVVATFCIVLLIGIAVRSIPVQRYTVKHGESVHRNVNINFLNNGIISGVDSEGRRFYYRDGWEVISEVKND